MTGMQHLYGTITAVDNKLNNKIASLNAPYLQRGSSCIIQSLFIYLNNAFTQIQIFGIFMYKIYYNSHIFKYLDFMYHIIRSCSAVTIQTSFFK